MPPKRMTANPVRPARYRPGKPIGPNESDSESESGSSEESESEEQKPLPKPVYKPQSKVKKDTTGQATNAGSIASALKDVDLEKRFDVGAKAGIASIEAKQSEDDRRKAEAKGSDDEYTTQEEESSEEEVEEEEEDDDDDDDIEEEEEAPTKVLLRPKFLSKADRKNASGAPDPDAAAKLQEAEEERKKKEAAELLEEHLKRSAAAVGQKGWDDEADNGEGVDDTDGLDPAAERVAWKLRELLRIKREREELEKIEKEREEIERRREMDPKLREKEDLDFVREQRKEKMENRGKMGFMQKFYHKGAFYQDADILKRDYATAAVEDSVKNREVLPKYMQVRGDEVGKRGRTRYTHLADEDTTIQAGGNPLFEKKPHGKFAPPPKVDDERFRPDNSRWDGHSGPRGHNGQHTRAERDSDNRPPRDRDDRRHEGREGDGDHERNRRGDGHRRPPQDRPRRTREKESGGDSYVPSGPRSTHHDHDRERKRPHSPRGAKRHYDGDKRRRRDTSPMR